jgi:hypothetical protein
VIGETSSEASRVSATTNSLSNSAQKLSNMVESFLHNVARAAA